MKSITVYAGFWRRSLAFIIDAVIIAIILIPLWVWFRQGLFGPQSGLYVLGYGAIIVLPVCLLVPLIYFAGFWTWRGQTPGKMACKVKILQTDGAPLGLGRAILRYTGYIICFGTMGIGLYPSYLMLPIRFIGLIGFIGIIIIAFHRQKRGLPDIIAGTSVTANP
ncbi:MAG: hypothetical protein DRI01_04515 [Chloroflexi bacterium]|nr:MAG: hypothetical protein DRI01_04515 [Chloroflexota bacterium]